MHARESIDDKIIPTDKWGDIEGRFSKHNSENRSFLDVSYKIVDESESSARDIGLAKQIEFFSDAFMLDQYKVATTTGTTTLRESYQGIITELTTLFVNQNEYGNACHHTSLIARPSLLGKLQDTPQKDKFKQDVKLLQKINPFYTDTKNNFSPNKEYVKQLHEFCEHEKQLYQHINSFKQVLSEIPANNDLSLALHKRAILTEISPLLVRSDMDEVSNQLDELLNTPLRLDTPEYYPVAEDIAAYVHELHYPDNQPKLFTVGDASRSPRVLYEHDSAQKLI